MENQNNVADLNAARDAKAAAEQPNLTAAEAAQIIVMENATSMVGALAATLPFRLQAAESAVLLLLLLNQKSDEKGKPGEHGSAINKSADSSANGTGTTPPSHYGLLRRDTLERQGHHRCAAVSGVHPRHKWSLGAQAGASVMVLRNWPRSVRIEAG